MANNINIIMVNMKGFGIIKKERCKMKFEVDLDLLKKI
jgi:hypothetical protein